MSVIAAIVPIAITADTIIAVVIIIKPLLFPIKHTLCKRLRLTLRLLLRWLLLWLLLPFWLPRFLYFLFRDVCFPCWQLNSTSFESVFVWFVIFDFVFVIFDILKKNETVAHRFHDLRRHHMLRWFIDVGYFQKKLRQSQNDSASIIYLLLPRVTAAPIVTAA